MRTYAIMLCLAVMTSGIRAAQARPNILLIVSDDAGYADFGFQGCKDIPTPHLDRMAAGGLRFTQGYVAGCVCSPSRAGLLSGKHPARIGHENNLSGNKGGIDTATTLLPARLKAVGYHTGAIGKWHLGSQPEYQPWRRGFDEFYGFVGGENNYLPPANKPGAKNLMLRNGEKVEEPEYTTTAFAREAVAFIERNQQQPWFLYLAFNAVHSPMQADPEREAAFTHIADAKRRVLAAMTASLDDAVGRVLERLDATGLATNTLVVFLNDNGGATYSRFYNTPLRGHKGTLFEGGIRVPFLARWPGRFAAGQGYSAPVSALDLLPTFLAAAGAEPGAWKDSDGVNLLPFLVDRAEGRPHQTLFWRFNVAAVVRDGDWKLVRIRDHAPLLFDLADDPCEAKDLASAQPERTRELLDKIEEWEKPFPAPKWTEGENWEKVHIKDHTGPPRYLAPGQATVATREQP